MNSQERVDREGGNGLEDKLLLTRNKEYLRENCEKEWLCIMFAEVSQKLECSVASNIAERPRKQTSSEPSVPRMVTFVLFTTYPSAASTEP